MVKLLRSFEHLLYIVAFCNAWLLGSFCHSDTAAFLLEEAREQNGQFCSMVSSLDNIILIVMFWSKEKEYAYFTSPKIITNFHDGYNHEI